MFSQKKGPGFSLLELLAVLVIVGLLTTMAIPGYTNMVERSKTRDAEGTLNLFFQAERMYQLDQSPPTYGNRASLINGRYLPEPEPNTDWDFDITAFAAATFTAQATRTGGPYDTNTISLDQSFDGSTYGGNHPLR